MSSNQTHQIVFDADDLATKAVRGALRNQKRILVIGTKHGNLPPWMANDPRVLQWPSDGPEVRRATVLPDAVGVVLFLRWVGHRHHDRLCAAAKDSGVYAHPELLGTGEMRRLLAPLQPGTLETPAEPPVAIPAPMPPDPPGQRWGGTLFGFVEEHYEYGSDHGHQKAEAERILRLAYAQGLTSSLASVQSTISSVHRTISRAREDARLATVPPVPDVIDLLAKPLDPEKAGPLTEVEAGKVQAAHGPLPVRTAPAPKPTVAALVAAGATNAAAVDTSVAELLRMLDDAVAVLGLAREQLVALSAQNTTMKSSHAALRARVLEVLDGTD